MNNGVVVRRLLLVTVLLAGVTLAIGVGVVATATTQGSTVIGEGDLVAEATSDGELSPVGQEIRESHLFASFAYSPDDPEAGEEVTFDASESEPQDEIVEYQWDLGDGTTETTADPVTTHAYDEAGTYAVELTIVDEAGETDSTTDQVDIDEAGEPTAICEVEPEVAEVGEEVTIDARDSENAVWAEFDTNGDGTVDETSDDLVVTVTYDEGGVYHPQVWVYADDGRSDTTQCQQISVTEPEEPTASFTYSPDQPEPGEEVTFDASESEPQDEIVEYQWDLGDGTIKTTADPVLTHVYDDVGAYTVALEVVDDQGRSGTDHGTVTVAERETPVAVCTVSPNAVESGEVVTLDASDSANAVAAEFDTTGDGTIDTPISEELVITLVYEQAEVYVPTVVVYDDAGRSDSTECERVHVFDPTDPRDAVDLSAGFVYLPDEPGVDEEVSFDATESTTVDEIVEYEWDFGDGTTETTAVPEASHTYDEPGNYTVTLTVVDGQGQTATATQELHIDGTVPVWLWLVLIVTFSVLAYLWWRYRPLIPRVVERLSWSSKS